WKSAELSPGRRSGPGRETGYAGVVAPASRRGVACDADLEDVRALPGRPFWPESRGRLRQCLRAGLAEAPGRIDRRAEVEALVLGLLDQHHGLERIDVVDPLLLALGRDLRLVRPVVELHLRDARDLANLAEIELDLVELF